MNKCTFRTEEEVLNISHPSGAVSLDFNKQVRQLKAQSLLNYGGPNTQQ